MNNLYNGKGLEPLPILNFEEIPNEVDEQVIENMRILRMKMIGCTGVPKELLESEDIHK